MVKIGKAKKKARQKKWETDASQLLLCTQLSFEQ